MTRHHRRPAAAWLLGLLATTALGAPPAGAQSLEEGFRNPPASARPRVWWHWMNGNITKDGIAKDLDWMSSVGLGGLQNFDAALQTPQIVDKRLVYMTPEWKDAFRYAAGLAQAKGLELTIAASPGWSETGGPWVKPADAMKKLVWSEVVVDGGRPLTGPLPAPPSATGPFQDVLRIPAAEAASTGRPDPVYYADVSVLAYPAPADAGAVVARYTRSDGGELPAAVLIDGALRTTVEVPMGAAAPAGITADFGAPRQVRALTFSLGRAVALFRSPTVAGVLEVEDSAGWRKLADVPVDTAAQTTVAFAPTTARRFRVRFTPLPPVTSGSDSGAVPGFAPVTPPPVPQTSLAVAEMRFTDEEQVDRFEAKGAYGLVLDYARLDRTDLADAAGVAPGAVVDLTARLRPDGTLDWTPPPGRWRIVRFGASLVGATNHPAPTEATGLEVDKFDGRAVADYINTYLAMYRSAAGADLIGAKGVRAILTDSIEVGPSNWTPALITEFKAARGYDPTPWLPTLAGAVIGSRADSDRFLYDWRLTLTELMSSQHYATVARIAHANGLKVYGEALETNRPVLGDDLAMRANADVPMAALWTYRREVGPRTTTLGDLKGAASVSHIYGQGPAAAESLTSGSAPWAHAPRDLKTVMDLILVSGINRPVIHTSVHQPEDTKLPGLSLGRYGQYFNRHETWSGMARPWIDYIARSAFLLQQGRDVADVAYFYGEDAPITALYSRAPPADLPTHYAFDFVNRDILQSELANDGVDLIAKRGSARYRAVYLGPATAQMTLPTLKRLAALVEGGATVIGPRPASTPSLADDPVEWRRLADRLWPGGASAQVGRGRVIATASVEDGLKTLGVTPDFTAEGAAPGDLLFLHRRLPDGEAYFLSNRKAGPVKVAARFRVTGKAPELWHADTGAHEPVSYRTEGGATVVPLDLDGDEAVFVVFRTPTKAPQATIARAAWTDLMTLDSGWSVMFEAGRGAPAETSLPRLASLSENVDPGIKYFSGVAAYTRNFTLPKAARAGGPLLLDLGEIGDVAQVRINGREAGIVWKAPYRLDIGKLVRPGANRIEVRVADLWANRLIGDAQPGAAKIAWTATPPPYLPSAPLRPSGLIGPVRLLMKAAVK